MIRLLQWAWPRLGDVVLILLLSLGLGSMAWAAPPVVKTVPWVASNPLIPHDTWSGKQITLKGTADVQGENIIYTWDFGDGSPVATGMVSNQYVIEAKHAYTGVVGAIFTARLTVQNTATGETGSREYYVQLRDKTLQVEVNVAIDEGLWALHRDMTRFSDSQGDKGDWRNWSSYGAVLAANMNAFEVNGHLEQGDPANPYVETVQRGMRRLFDYLASTTISTQTYPDIGTVDPDSDGNGRAIYVGQGQYVYQGGMFMDAIIASGTPDKLTASGNGDIIGRKYKDIVQDMVDGYAYGQSDSGGSQGGWRYDWNGGSDNSVCQWAAIGLIPAEREWGLTVPAWVKQQNLIWLGYSQNADGWFGYDWSNSFPWGPYATTPSGMVQLAMDGVGRGDPRWDKAESRIRDNFGNTGGPGNAIKDYYYGLFSFTKSMLLHDSNHDGVAEPIQFLQSQTPNVPPLDWYSAEVSKGDPTDGVARKLINDQHADGWWWYHDPSGDQYPFDTAFAIIMLNRTLFAQGAPVAVAKAIPNPGVANQTITLDGSASFHQDSNRKIVGWEWDLNNDGVYERTGPAVTTSFPALGDYPVRLRVTDDSTPARTAETVVTVRITTPPLAPTANAGGPYVFCPGQKWFLDGTRSVNPDEGLHEPGKPGDTIQRYQWDLDGNNDFAEANGPQPDVTAYFGGRGVGNYLVQLKVTDTTATSFPSSGQPDLSSTATAQVSVKDAGDAACKCITDLSARTKSGKVELLWKDTGAHHYNVYKGTTQGGPYSLLVATDSRYATYVDFAVTNGTTYYYVVREAQASGAERCQSNEARITPNDRTVRNRAPVFSSTPVTGATEGVLYSYDVNATDADAGDILTYSLDIKPSGMTIDPTTGLIQWMPANAQVGVQNVVVRVTDKAGASVTQTFQITVANANNPPRIVSTAVTAATESQPYSYQVQVFDPDVGDTASYFLDVAPTGMSITAVGLIQWTPTTAQIGVQNVTVRVQDKAGATASQSYQVTVAELNRPPQIISTPPGKATEGELYLYHVIGSDPNQGDRLTFALELAPAGMSIDPTTGLIQWTPTESQVGSAAVTIRVTDAGGLSSTQSFGITVQNHNDPPQIVSIPITVATQDQLYSYLVLAQDPDMGEKLTFLLIPSPPSGMAINPTTGLIQWRPTNAQVGQHSVRVVVRDSGGLEDAQSFIVTVANVNDPPVITSTPPTQALTGTLYSYAVAATDPDVGDSLSYSLITAPAGMVIGPSGLIQWTPGSGQAGAHPVVVQVRDLAGSTVVQSYTLTVKQVVTVPNVVGQMQATAEAALTAANLAVGTVTEDYSDTVPQGAVISQDPTGGAQVAEGSAVSLVVSKGPEPIKPKTLNLLLNQTVVNGGDNLPFTYEVVDNKGNVMAPTPPVDLQIESVPAQTTGTAPSIDNGKVITATDTQGSFTLKGTVQGTTVTAGVNFVVLPNATVAGQLTLYSEFSSSQIQITGAMDKLVQAVKDNDLPAIQSLKNALVAARDSIDLNELRGSTAFAPAEGFPPSLQQLAAAGFSETADDVALGNLVMQLTAKLEQITAFLNALDPASPTDDEARLNQLNNELQALINQFAALNPTVYGVVKWSSQLNWMLANTLPLYWHAVVNRTVTTLQQNGLAYLPLSPAHYYAGSCSGELPTGMAPAVFYSQTRPAFFGLIGLLGGSNIQVQLVLKIYGPAITYLENAMIILAAEHLLNQYVNNMGLEGIITGASLSFHIFHAGGSVIEGNGFSRIPGRNKVYLVGPNQVNAARGVIDAFRAEVDGKSINSIIKYIKGIAQAVDDAGGSAQESTQWPTDLAFGCILDPFSNDCLELVYDEGFNSVYSPSGFPIPAPVLIMVTNLDTGEWAFSLFNFLPASND